MDCVIRATPVQMTVATATAIVRVVRLRVTKAVIASTVALVSRPVSIGNCSISAVPAEAQVRGELSHV